MRDEAEGELLAEDEEVAHRGRMRSLDNDGKPIDQLDQLRMFLAQLVQIGHAPGLLPVTPWCPRPVKAGRNATGMKVSAGP